MALRIGIEAHVVGKRPSGNGRVVANLIRALLKVSNHTVVAYFTDPDVAASWRAEGLARLTVRVVRPSTPAVRIPVALPLWAARDRVDVFLAHDNCPPVAPCPVVTLVHDVAFARYPQYFTLLERLWMPRTIPASMRRSGAVVTVSEFTRSEIIDLYGISPEKIVVAHNGVGPEFAEPSGREPPVPPPFFVAVGNLQPRKNLSTLVRAFRRVLDRHPDLPERLVIVGQPAYGASDLLREVADLQRLSRLEIAGYLPDDQMVALLQGCTAFAYPSVYEGFGLPPLEAMAAGAPALVADIPVMREVVADAAMRLPATDPAAWEAALWRVASDEGWRTRLAQAGRARAARFTWEASAERVAAVLERAAAARS